MLRVARNGAVKARTAALNTLRSMVITAPEPLRTQLRSRSSAQLVAACARLRPDLTNLAEPVQAAKHALRSIASRVQHLDTETRLLRTQLDELTRAAAPASSAVFGLGPDTVSALLITIGDNPDRLRSEAAFAHLCGVAPIPASSGKPTATGCTAAATGPATVRCTSPPSCASATTPAAGPTPTDEPHRVCPCPKSSAARSATWPAKSFTHYAPTTPNSALDIYRSVLGHLPERVLLHLRIGE
jgi:Transposase IS116/IS110/IS902 family